MEKKVESKQQSGGITAENVNIVNHNHVTVKEPAKKKKNKMLKNFLTVLSILAALATILTWIESHQKKPSLFINDKTHQIQPNK